MYNLYSLWMVKMSLKPVKLMHVPKTGGTTIGQSSMIKSFHHGMAIEEPGQINWIYSYQNMKHAKGNVVMLSELAKWYVISIVRNPFSWLVSYADWASCFSSWNSGHNDYENAKKGFDSFIRNIASREGRWPCRKFIFVQLFTPSGTCSIDHVFHNEYLESELTTFFSERGQSYSKQRRRQQGRRKGEDRKAISEYYTPELAELVYTTWRREFELLGYGSDPAKLYPEGGLLNGATAKNKKRVRYVWSTNTLTINGKEVNYD
jgi:hypothetical protein